MSVVNLKAHDLQEEEKESNDEYSGNTRISFCMICQKSLIKSKQYLFFCMKFTNIKKRILLIIF